MLNRWRLSRFVSAMVGLLVLSPSCTSPTSPTSSFHDRFPGISTVRVQLAQGHAFVEGSDDGLVTIQYESSYPTTCHRPEILLNSDTLEIRGAFEPVACPGRTEVHIQVPAGISILFHGAQAGLTIDGAAVSTDAYAKSIQVRDAQLTGDSKLQAQDGDVQVILGEPPRHSLNLSSNGGGNVLLEVGDEDLQGRFVFSVKEGEGRIKSPYPFDRETRYDCECEPSATWWIRKEFTLEEETPVFSLSTRDGVAELRLRG